MSVKYFNCRWQHRGENHTCIHVHVTVLHVFFCFLLLSFVFLLFRILYFNLIPLFLAHLAFRPGELLSSLFVRRLSSVVRPSTFHILIFSSETTGPIATKFWWNGPWMAPFQNCVCWSRLPTKMAAKLKIEKKGDEILIVHCCFSVNQNELKF
jgi:hypothetical protein